MEGIEMAFPTSTSAHKKNKPNLPLLMDKFVIAIRLFPFL
jgi:hypothetical protein